jgi:hypothetical protein
LKFGGNGFERFVFLFTSLLCFSTVGQVRRWSLKKKKYSLVVDKKGSFCKMLFENASKGNNMTEHVNLKLRDFLFISTKIILS